MVQQHTLQINCTSVDFGKEVQNTVAMVLEKEFYPKLESLLNIYSLPDYIWKIDKLEIELPPLSKKNWKEEIVTHSLQQIDAYLKLHFENMEQHLNGTDNPQTLFLQEIIAENLFFDFLKKGFIPENGQFQNIEELIIKLEINDSMMQKLLSLFLENPNSLIRFIYTFSELFKSKIENRLEGFQNGFRELLQSALVSKATYFSQTILETWIEFMAWQFYFLKEKKITRFEVYNTIKIISSEYWDIKISSFLVLKELLNPEIISYNTHQKFMNSEFIAFWEAVLNDFTSLNKNKAAAVEEKNTLEILGNDELESPNSKTENLIYVENAGLILFHPFLERLFEQLDLIENGSWTNKINQHKAILLTQFLINGETKIGENELVLNKILCGFPTENAVNTKLEISQREIEKCESLLLAVIGHWKILGDTSIAGLRETFLQRKGKILLTENKKIELWVKQEGVDVLLNQLPWGIEIIKTPWMEDFLNCYWN
ncbi:contractile injection system tape measure protein [Flavobacterium sp. HJJ]|uniref:contractile injection system tape measure protein n=1 Tax=Flavobacterium sp. HJJ TaxID=2783792 RepID=UPI00188D7807|nr:contractile injection system tape measure protein [Flavobacterium sp. HJJ]MBF4471649.1 hypothetical protein [Flavobacterium sp. HJJ]